MAEEKMSLPVFLGNKLITLTFKSFDEEVDVDALTSIDYSNLYGEAVTVSALLNKVGILKADAENKYSLKKMELDCYEAELKQRIRRTSTETAQKITENGVQEQVEIDTGFKTMKKNMIKAKYNWDVVDSIFWSVSAKNKKLDNLVKGLTPEELYNELIEGTINNIVIKKHKSILDKR